MTRWRDLTAALEGDVVVPGSPRYDEVRRPQIPRFHDVRPQAVVLSRTPADVAEAIACARLSFGSMVGSETETAALLDEFVSVAGAVPAASEGAHMRYGSMKKHLAERGPGDACSAETVSAASVTRVDDQQVAPHPS